MQIFKEGFVYTITSFIQKSIPFILLPYLTRVLTPEMYGMIGIFLSLVMIYSFSVGSSMIGFVRVIYHKTSKENFPIFLSNILIFFTILCSISICISFIFKLKISEYISIDFKYILFAILVAIFNFILNIRLVIYQTMRNAFSYAKLQLMQPFIEIFLIFFLIFFLNKGADGRIFSILISSFLIAMLSLALLYKSKLLLIHYNYKYLKRILRFILPLFPHSLALTSIFAFDKIFISANSGLSLVGEYTVALSLSLPIWMLAESVNKAFLPWSFEKFKKLEFDTVVGASYLLLIIFFIISLIYSIFIYFTIGWFVGEKYNHIINPTIILVWIGWLKLAYHISTKGLVYSENMRYVSLITISSVAFYFIMLLIENKDLNLIKLAIFLNVTHVIIFAGGFILSQLKFPQPWYNFSSTLTVLHYIMNFVKEKCKKIIEKKNV